MADEDMADQLLRIIKLLHPHGMVSYGFDTCEELVAEGKARFVILAADTSPFGFVMRIPLLCEDENVKYIYIRSQWDLAAALDKEKPVYAVAVTHGSENLAAKVKRLNLRSHHRKAFSLDPQALEMIRRIDKELDEVEARIEAMIEEVEARIQDMLDDVDLVDEDDMIIPTLDKKTYIDNPETPQEDWSSEEIDEFAASLI